MSDITTTKPRTIEDIMLDLALMAEIDFKELLDSTNVTMGSVLANELIQKRIAGRRLVMEKYNSPFLTKH